MAERAVLFDVIGTLVDLAPLRERLGPPALEAWFERLLHSAASLTLAGTFRPFKKLAGTTLETTAVRLELNADVDEVLGLLAELPPQPDATLAFYRLERARVRIATLTNGGEETTQRLLERAGLADRVEAIFTVEEVEAYKPHPDPYRHAVESLGLAPQDVTLIAAHAWDVIGAQGAQLQAIWVDRDERRWPFPLPEPRRAGNLEHAADMVVGMRR
jgi:2-haloacid dehalogenase